MTSMLVKYWFIKKNLMAKKAPSNNNDDDAIRP